LRGLGDIYLRKDGKSPFYWVKYYDARGKRRRESTGTTDKKLAQQILKRRILEFDGLRSGVKQNSDMPYEVFSEDFLKYYRARYGFETVKSHTSVVNEFKKFLDMIGIGKLSDITPGIINKYITYRRDAIKNKANTCNNHLKNLYTQFQYAISNKLLFENPAKGIKKIELNDVEEKEALTKDEYQRFMKTCKKEYPFYYPIFYVFFHTGLRFSELINQKWCDIDLENKILRVTKPKGKKKESNDYISIHTGVVDILSSLRHSCEYVFTDEKGSPFGPRTRKFIRRLKDILIKAKISKKCNLHTTRHTYCSQLFNEAGLSSAEVQRQMRHTELRTTNSYAHIFRPELNRKIERLKKLDKIGT